MASFTVRFIATSTSRQCRFKYSVKFIVGGRERLATQGDCTGEPLVKEVNGVTGKGLVSSM